MVYQIDGALASSLTARQARIDQHSCFILATNELDATQLPPQELLDGYKGQVHAERGFRFLKDPQFLASSLYLKKPERIMALLMVMTVCLLVYAALEYRIRQALKDHEATFPDQKGKRIQQSDSAVGVPLFCGDSLAVSGRPMAAWCSISPRNISTCFASLANLTCGFMTSDIRKNHEGDAECRLQWSQKPRAGLLVLDAWTEDRTMQRIAEATDGTPPTTPDATASATASSREVGRVYLADLARRLAQHVAGAESRPGVAASLQGWLSSAER